MHDDIRYHLQRARTEIRQARRAINREVIVAHFNLADAYLERIHQLVQEIGEAGVKE